LISTTTTLATLPTSAHAATPMPVPPGSGSSVVSAQAASTPFRDPEVVTSSPGVLKHIGPDPSAHPLAQAPYLGTYKGWPTACVSGSLTRKATTGETVPARNWTVEVWDDDAGSADDLLAVATTDLDGKYSACFDNHFDPGSAGNHSSSTQDVFLRLRSISSRFRVIENGSPITITTGVKANRPDLSSTSYGTRAVPAAQNLGAIAFATANRAWAWIPTVRDPWCWDMDDSSCRMLTILWAENSTDDTRYTMNDNRVHLMANDPRAPFLVLHEIGHALMDDLYDDKYPSTPSCTDHAIPDMSSAGCAWSEGFAEWFPAMVLADKSFDWADGTSLDMENRDKNSVGWDDGATVEGRVAGALIDLSDSANESGDQFTDGDNHPLPTLLIVARQHPKDFAAYWAARKSLGYDTGTKAANTVRHNTINV
jgi:hypothetical protein